MGSCKFIFFSILIANICLTQSSLNHLTISSTAVNASGENVVLNGTAGQVIIGKYQGDNTILSSGLWGSILSIFLEVDDLVPMEFAISNAYPNPFNPTVNIDFEIPEQSDVDIKIFDLLGRNVFTHKQVFNSPGKYRFKWHGINNSGFSIASGIYLVVVQHKSNLYKQKITFLK